MINKHKLHRNNFMLIIPIKLILKKITVKKKIIKTKIK